MSSKTTQKPTSQANSTTKNGPRKSKKASGPVQPQAESAPPRKKTHPRPKKDDWLFKGTGKEFAAIQSSQLATSSAVITSSGEHDTVCSYSWLQESIPTIYVPGNPPRYVSTQVPLDVPKDSGWNFVDHDSFRLPDYPFEVVFRAMDVMNPDYKFDDVDVLINRNTLRKLLDFSRGKCNDSFRINLFMVANTLIVERCEKNARNLVRGSANAGWGHNFETAITEPVLGMSDTAGHHRVLRYDFGGLSCAVRFEVDASYGDSSLEEPKKQNDSANPQTDATDLSEKLDALKIQIPPQGPKAKISNKIRVIPWGSGILQSTAAEIKSMATPKSLGMMLPQLWFGRTETLIRGIHRNGVFHNIQVRNIQKELQNWENEDKNQTALRKTAMLLTQLRDVCKASEEKACVAVCQKTPKSVPLVLQVFPSTRRKAPLPQDIRKRFWEKG